ncbi:L,D-transpeptidase [Pseudoclavibacter soli]|uniref:L,D-transpeptidase n=1 Tax=Pseudoclavibacter soli TaxID=452623 RepID=UPI00041C0816|nr:L,D-transpeptidase [Pseudoclavibacter soli]
MGESTATTEEVIIDAAESSAQQSTLGLPTGAPQSKRRKLPWVLGGVGVVVAAAIGGLAWYSADHAAPNVTFAGQNVGGASTAELAEIIQQRFDDYSIDYTFDGEAVSVTAADLDLSVDAEATARDIIAAQPVWQPWTWNRASSVVATVQTNDSSEQQFFSQTWPTAFTATEPTLSYVAASDTFSVQPGEAGQGIDSDEAAADFVKAFSAGLGTPQEVEQVDVQPAISVDQATAVATELPTSVQALTFTVGDDEVATADRATVGSWVVGTVVDGEYQATLNRESVAAFVNDSVVAKVNRETRTAKVLKDTDTALVEGQTGRTITDVDGLIDQVATTGLQGTTTFAVSVDEQQFETIQVDRRIDIALAARTASLIEDGQVVATFPMSPGLGTNTVGQSAATATDVGEFKVWYKTSTQTMRGTNTDGSTYETPNVKWSTFYNGDEALHGTYWHNKFGIADMSHGCVNLSEANAKTVYDFAPIGTPVSVHY